MFVARNNNYIKHFSYLICERHDWWSKCFANKYPIDPYLMTGNVGATLTSLLPKF